MKVSSINVFNEEGGPLAHIRNLDKEDTWPVTLNITNNIKYSYTKPLITFYMTIPELIEFKNSLLGSFNKAMREAGYDR